ncbi:hypothetical protein LAZ67_21001905 [Cordylochernes scorpioides]|uniref:Reverse transcriptase domain-containing protein n=1 Tax=Cordylochernes scorpioides TaxID=51811 RepID=A0ABY6LPT4_9ARAC|nr:hypothetical protein LAZ67_21001905 [Cordylochernes scorpioides]
METTTEGRQEVRETSETTAPLADAVNQLSTLLTRAKNSDGAESAISPFDGTYSATQFFQTFDRKMEDASMGEQEKLLRLPNYLVRQPLELFRKLRLADRSYFQVRQILLDLYPESSEASFCEIFRHETHWTSQLRDLLPGKNRHGIATRTSTRGDPRDADRRTAIQRPAPSPRSASREPRRVVPTGTADPRTQCTGNAIQRRSTTHNVGSVPQHTPTPRCMECTSSAVRLQVLRRETLAQRMPTSTSPDDPRKSADGANSPKTTSHDSTTAKSSQGHPSRAALSRLRIEDILDRLAQAKYFSTADISSAYWQVPIHPDSRPLLAFATFEGLYQPTRLPFGLKTSPQIYERAISQVLQRHGLDCVAHYFDDFIIYSNTLEEHQNHLRQFFAFCEAEKLQLNFAKCEFFKQSINFLGYTITAGTITPLTRNTDIIHAIKQPHNRKTLQSFLGAVNVYNKFIPEYARLRAPLNNLLKKDVVWNWNEACQEAFIDLKGNLTQHPILHLYKEGLPCQVYCDASTLGIAGILKQVHPDGNVYPVQYFSRTLRPHEKNYSISELECLAIVESVEKFRIYLMGRKFTIFSDHHALQWLKTIKNPSGRLFRWSLRLSSYEYEVRYIKGKLQYEADLLSRNPFCGFLDATLIKTHQSPPSKESSLTIDHNGLHTVSRKVGPTYGELSQPPESKEPFDLLSLDTIAGFAKYGNTKIYLHVVVDHFSRYAWAFPSKSTSTTTYQQGQRPDVSSDRRTRAHLPPHASALFVLPPEPENSPIVPPVYLITYTFEEASPTPKSLPDEQKNQIGDLYHLRRDVLDIVSSSLTPSISTPTKKPQPRRSGVIRRMEKASLMKSLIQRQFQYRCARDRAPEPQAAHDVLAEAGRVLYEKYLAGEKWKNVVTLDETWVYLNDSNQPRAICYVNSQINTFQNWVKQCKESFSNVFMIVACFCYNGKLPLKKVDPNVKINSQIYQRLILDILFNNELPFLIIVDQVILNYEESVRVRVCYRCCGYGHNADRCTKATVTCFHCASGDHQGRSCPTLANPRTAKCANCLAKGLSADHEARSMSCPTARARAANDLTLAHRYWSCRYIRPLIWEAFTIIPPDLQVFGQGLDNDTLAILAMYEHPNGSSMAFLEGRQNVHDDGRPVTATDNPAIAAVRNVVEADRRGTINEIMIRLPPGIEIERSLIGTIMSDVFNFCKVCARWVPRLLSENHKQQRMEAARPFLEMHRRDKYQLFSCIVTGDESWVHHSTPETKRQSMVSKKPEESAPKKAKVTISEGKVMAIVFWDYKSILLVEYLPPNTTVNAARIIHTPGGKSPRLLLAADVTRLCPPPQRNAVLAPATWQRGQLESTPLSPTLLWYLGLVVHVKIGLPWCQGSNRCKSEDPRVSRHVCLASDNQGKTASLQLHWTSVSGTPTEDNTQRRLNTHSPLDEEPQIEEPQIEEPQIAPPEGICDRNLSPHVADGVTSPQSHGTTSGKRSRYKRFD